MKKWIRALRYHLIRLFRLKTTAHRISLGFVFGFFHCWYPTFGVGGMLSLVLTKLLRGNLIAAGIASLLGSVVWPLFFYFNVVTGQLILGMEGDSVSAPGWSGLGKEFMLGAAVNSIWFAILSYVLLNYLLQRHRLTILQWLISVHPNKKGAA